ncbi:MAG: InterPro IPR005134 COGs COG2862, partial [uncultured Ramlibacter sp.]
ARPQPAPEQGFAAAAAAEPDLRQPLAPAAPVPGPDRRAGGVRLPLLGRAGAPAGGCLRQPDRPAAVGEQHRLQGHG